MSYAVSILITFVLVFQSSASWAKDTQRQYIDKIYKELQKHQKGKLKGTTIITSRNGIEFYQSGKRLFEMTDFDPQNSTLKIDGRTVNTNNLNSTKRSMSVGAATVAALGIILAAAEVAANVFPLFQETNEDRRNACANSIELLAKASAEKIGYRLACETWNSNVEVHSKEDLVYNMVAPNKDDEVWLPAYRSSAKELEETLVKRISSRFLQGHPAGEFTSADSCSPIEEDFSNSMENESINKDLGKLANLYRYRQQRLFVCPYSEQESGSQSTNPSYR